MLKTVESCMEILKVGPKVVEERHFLQNLLLSLFPNFNNVEV